jgi:Putative zinc-finger
MTDPFLHDDAPYVLGALDEDDRRAFEAHLETCPDCQARVADLRGTARLLAAVPRDADAEAVPEPVPMPDTLLPGLLRRAAKERRRRQFVTGAIASVAAACVIALGIVVWPGGGSSTPSRPPAQALTAVQPIPLKVTARLTDKAWGTKIDLHCTYPANENDRFAYDLVVIDRANRPHAAGDWSLVPGKGGIDFTTGTSVPRDQIRQLQVRAPGGTTLLQLQLK